MNEKLERLRALLESEMDLDAIREEEYREVLMEEIANDVRRQARQEAEAEIERRDRQGKPSR